ncbi:hypothetical protein PQR62_05495 [Herbaspirillum lusitanum]|uniref:Uncharacterized protein n=1 Tax=Herbaspirillum lusitanum TaxID=213312 RepID=A0ABW9A497_9BURK
MSHQEPESSSSISPATPSPSSRHRVLGRFFSSQAMLCLITLMVFLGLLIALAPVGLGYLHQDSKAGQGGTRSAGAARDAATCNPILARFADDAPMGKLNQALERLDTSIAFGPNENGAFELSVTETGAPDKAAAVVDALNRMPELVIVASLRDQCLRSQ